MRGLYIEKMAEVVEESDDDEGAEKEASEGGAEEDEASAEEATAGGECGQGQIWDAKGERDTRASEAAEKG